MNLEQLISGQRAIIKEIRANDNVKRRLMLLGFAAGQNVAMIKSAPLKDPLEVSLQGGHLSIRRSEAALIEVELINGDPLER